MKPSRAYEIHRTDRGAVVVVPVLIVEMEPAKHRAQIQRAEGGYTVRTWVALSDLALNVAGVAARVAALLEQSAPPFPSAAEPPRNNVAGPAQPPAAEPAAAGA